MELPFRRNLTSILYTYYFVCASIKSGCVKQLLDVFDRICFVFSFVYMYPEINLGHKLPVYSVRSTQVILYGETRMYMICTVLNYSLVNIFSCAYPVEWASLGISTHINTDRKYHWNSQKSSDLCKQFTAMRLFFWPKL